MSNKIFMIVGCSGAGKSTQVNSLLSSGLDLTRGIICTTRAPRAGEMNTIDYIFTSVDGLKLDVPAKPPPCTRTAPLPPR